MLAFHGIFGAYGFWLPNDPRGSWSSWVGKWELYRAAGSGTKTNETRYLAHVDHDFGERLRTKQLLRYPPVRFTGLQARAVGRGFSKAVEKSNYRILACSIMPEHVHLVIAAHDYRPGLILGHLKREATLQLLEESCHPMQHFCKPEAALPTCWAKRSWKVYLDRESDVHRAVRYVEENPIKEGKLRQHWACVVPFGLNFTSSKLDG